MPETQTVRAPRRRKGRPQPRQQCHDLSSFDRATFMFLRPSADFVLWNSTSAMRRNGHRPSGVAAYLAAEFGIHVYDPRRIDDDSPYPFEALAYFERLVGVNAPSLVYDEPWGRA